MNLAPIVLFTFNRLEHTKETINALKKNYLASESELFIYSDGARNELEKVKINDLRIYLRGIDGFKKITIIESEKNMGLAKSVINGVTDIINKYKKIIVLEDDLITSKYFLCYMNESLNMFKSREDIWSIAGYSPNINICKKYNDDIYLTKRGCSWGWATWKDRWDSIDWDIADYIQFKKSRKLKKEFNVSGSDMSPMLDDQMNGRINSWAIRWCYNQFKQNKLTVYPKISMVKNIGTDLSGTHSSKTSKYDVNINQKNILINKEIKVQKEILNQFKEFYDIDLLGYVAIGLKKIGLYRFSRKIRNVIIQVVR